MSQRFAFHENRTLEFRMFGDSRMILWLEISSYSSACFGSHEVGGIAINMKDYITHLVSYVCLWKGVDVAHEALIVCFGVKSQL